MSDKREFSRRELDTIETDSYLTDRERTVFVLKFRRGWKHEDVAAELDISRRTVTTIVKNIRSKALEIL